MFKNHHSCCHNWTSCEGFCDSFLNLISLMTLLTVKIKQCLTNINTIYLQMYEERNLNESMNFVYSRTRQPETLVFTSRCNHFTEITTTLESSQCDNAQRLRVHHRNIDPKSLHHVVKLLSRSVLWHISILLEKIGNGRILLWASLILYHSFLVFYFFCVFQQDQYKQHDNAHNEQQIICTIFMLLSNDCKQNCRWEYCRD